jgi:hypothetical protein
MSTFLRRLSAGALLLAATVVGRCMSVIPPTFDQLVTASDLIVRGVVTDVHSVTVDTPRGQVIRTLVTFHIEKTLKGSAGADVTLSFLGGTVGHRTLTVHGMPKFDVGAREIVFVANNGHAMCPVLAAGHGRYHVRHDAAVNRDFVIRDNGDPLHSTDDIAAPLEGPSPARALSQSDSLTSDAFETKIESAVHSSRAVQLP